MMWHIHVKDVEMYAFSFQVIDDSQDTDENKQILEEGKAFELGR